MNGVVHHKDFNGENNNPDNLEVMTWAAHEQLHKDTGTYSLNKQWNDPEGREKLIAGMRRLYDDATPEFNDRLSERNRANGLWNMEKPRVRLNVRWLALSYIEKSLTRQDVLGPQKRNI